MSEVEGEREKSKVVVSEDGDGEEEENVKNQRKIKERVEDGGGCGCGCGCGCGNARGLEKAKKVVGFRFSNAKKHRTRRRLLFGGETGSRWFCFKQSSSSSGVDSSDTTSDPNDPRFSCEKLRSLIENNHFYSPDCNPHFHSPLTPYK